MCICQCVYAHTQKITPYHLHLFTNAQPTFPIPRVLLYFHRDLKGLIYIRHEMPLVNLCNSTGSRITAAIAEFTWVLQFCVVILCRTCMGLQVQLILEKHRAVILARKWFKAMKLAMAEGEMGLISHSTSDSQQSVWYYRWTGTPSGVVCPLLTPRVCQRWWWWNLVCEHVRIKSRERRLQRKT